MAPEADDRAAQVHGSFLLDSQGEFLHTPSHKKQPLIPHIPFPPIDQNTISRSVYLLTHKTNFPKISPQKNKVLSHIRPCPGSVDGVLEIRNMAKVCKTRNDRMNCGAMTS